MAAKTRPHAPYGIPAVVTGGARLLAWCKSHPVDAEKIRKEAEEAAKAYQAAGIKVPKWSDA